MTDKRLLTPLKRALLDAADYIEMYGWLKGDVLDEGPRDALRTKLMPSACLMGAIRMTCHGDEMLYASAIGLMVHHTGHDMLGDWNDAHDTTQEMVVHALRGAALDAEA